MPTTFGSRVEGHAFKIASVFLIVCFSIAYLPPAKTIMPEHDFLNSVFLYYVLRAKTDFFFNVHASLPILHGTTLAGTGLSDFAVVPNLYLVLPPFTAFAASQVLIRTLGFLGMFFLLTDHVLPDFRGRRIVAAGTAILFALLRHWDRVGTIEIVPLACFALINLATGRRLRLSWLVIVAVPFFWTFALGGFVIVGCSVVIALYAVAARKPYWQNLAIVAALWIVMGLAFEYRQIWFLFFSGFTSHRVEFDMSALRPNATFGNFLHEFFDDVIFGQYHHYSGQFPIPLIAIGLALIRIALSWGDGRTFAQRLLLWLIPVSLVLSVFYAGESSGVTKFLTWFPIPFQIGRVVILHPLLIGIIFALSVSVLCECWPGHATLIASTFAVLVALQGVLTANSVAARIADRLKWPRCGVLQDAPTCTQREMEPYYRIPQYRELAKIIGRPQKDYWVASLDIDPMIAAFNGFQTIDGYIDIYSLAYKHAFEPIIKDELDANPLYSMLYRKWGSMVYLFHAPGEPVRINFCAAQKIGADYIISPLDLADLRLKRLGAAGDLKAYAIDKSRCAG